MPRISRASLPRRALRGLTAPVMLALTLGWAASVVAQDVTEPSLKAAFIYNIAKFATWPADMLPDGTPLSACVIGDTPVGRALERQLVGKSFMGHPVAVTRLAVDASARACHLLYTGGLPSSQLQQVVAATRGWPVLTVADTDANSHPGGVAHIFVENGKLRFNLDHGLARQSRLQLSSKLLALAKHVYDHPAEARGTR